MKLNRKLFVSALAVLLASSGSSLAAGYSTNLTSTSAMANAYAGSVTGVHDISDVFYNPAVTVDLEKSQFIASASYLKLDIDTTGSTGSSNITTASGGDSGGGSHNFVPAFYFATPINDNTTLNFAVTTPFGLSTDYDEDWAGRYIAVESSISTLNFNPSIAYKVSDKFSVGAGVVAQYYKATLTKAVDIGASDVTNKITASDWGYGYNLGASYKFNDQLDLAIGYRSKITYDLSGTSRVAGISTYSNIQAKTVTPESLTVGASYQLNDNVELAYDTTWTRWSRLKSLIVDAYQNTAAGGQTTFNWKDSFIHSLGANFSVNNSLLIRTGLAYEKDASTDANRGPSVPGGDRIWATLGFSKKLNDSWTVDGSYVHQFYRSANMNITDVNGNSAQTKYKTKVDVFSIAIKKDF